MIAAMHAHRPFAAHASACALLQVKNFGNEEVESAKFSSAVDKYNAAEYSMTMAFNVIGLLQGTIVFCATALGLVLCVKASPFLCFAASLGSRFCSIATNTPSLCQFRDICSTRELPSAMHQVSMLQR